MAEINGVQTQILKIWVVVLTIISGPGSLTLLVFLVAWAREDLKNHKKKNGKYDLFWWN